ARRREQDLRDALGLEVTAKARAVTPRARVVDDDGVVDAVGRVVDGLRRVRVDELDVAAVDDERVLLGADLDAAEEGAVHGVATKEARALDEVALDLLAHDDRAEAIDATGARLVREDAGEDAADAAEAVEHDVPRALGQSALADVAREGPLGEG